MNSYFISVVVPNYNHCKYLKQRLDSILNQSYQKFEVIILDDYSTDFSISIIEDYKHHYKINNILYNSQNSGSPFLQWAKGIKYANGDLIWFAESDDIAHPQFLERMVKQFEKHPEIGIAFCSIENIDANGRTLGLNTWAHALDERKWKTSFIKDGQYELSNSFLFRNVVPNASSVVFRKEYCALLGPIISGKMKYAGDWLFWVYILSKTKVSYLSEVLCYQRNHDKTTRINLPIKDEIAKLKEYISVIKVCSSLLGKEVNWLDKRYDWIFEYFGNVIPDNILTRCLLSLDAKSYTFYKRLQKYQLRYNV